VADEWTHEDDLRPALAAMVEELAAALQVPDRFTLERPARLRLLRLRLVLDDALTSGQPMVDALAQVRADLAEPLPDQRRPPYRLCRGSR
jgi:hypothetical protein